MIRKLFSCILFMLYPLQGHAMTLHTSKITCPIGGEKFEAVLASSGTSFGNYLDLKPYGPTPAPWPIAKCPGNGFVLYKDSFTAAEIKTLEAFVNSKQYQADQKRYSNYYLAAKLRAHAGTTKRELAYTLLYATWEAESRDEYEKYALEALDAFRQSLMMKYDNQENWSADQLVAGELERRTDDFDAAEKRFTDLSLKKEFQTGILNQIVKLQLSLINSKNSSPAKIPQNSKQSE